MKRRPNILISVSDDWHYGLAGAYGCTWINTPGFDAVAQRGLLFTRAYTPNAKCAPSRACLLTGRNPWQLEEAGNHIAYFPQKFTTFPEALAANGYFVGCTQKGWGPGLARNADGSERELTGRGWNERRCTPELPTFSGNDYAANFADFVAAAGDQPWCFWYGSQEPHRPFTPGSGVAPTGRRPSDVDRVPAYWPDNDTVRSDMLDYARAIEQSDKHLARMVALLEQRGELENTIVIVTSDHGMPFPRAKGAAYDAGTRRPLAIAWPGGIAEPGRVVEDFVSFIDFAPTLLELAGVPWEKSRMQPAAGRSFVPLLTGDAATRRTWTRDHVLVGQERHDVGRPDDVGYPIRGIVEGDLYYLENFEPDRWPACNPETGYMNADGGPTKTEVLKSRHDPARRHLWELCFGKRPREELYHLRTDPDCVRNLAQNPAWRAAKTALREKMLAELRAEDDPRIRGEGGIFDRYPVYPEVQQNYYRKWQRGEAFLPDWIEASDREPEWLESAGTASTPASGRDRSPADREAKAP